MVKLDSICLLPLTRSTRKVPTCGPECGHPAVMLHRVGPNRGSARPTGRIPFFFVFMLDIEGPFCNHLVLDILGLAAKSTIHGTSPKAKHKSSQIKPMDPFGRSSRLPGTHARSPGLRILERSPAEHKPETPEHVPVGRSTTSVVCARFSNFLLLWVFPMSFSFGGVWRTWRWPKRTPTYQHTNNPTHRLGWRVLNSSLDFDLTQGSNSSLRVAVKWLVVFCSPMASP